MPPSVKSFSSWSCRSFATRRKRAGKRSAKDTEYTFGTTFLNWTAPVTAFVMMWPRHQDSNTSTRPNLFSRLIFALEAQTCSMTSSTMRTLLAAMSALMLTATVRSPFSAISHKAAVDSLSWQLSQASRYVPDVASWTNQHPLNKPSWRSMMEFHSAAGTSASGTQPRFRSAQSSVAVEA